jgi:hypothetical protein
VPRKQQPNIADRLELDEGNQRTIESTLAELNDVVIILEQRRAANG